MIMLGALLFSGALSAQVNLGSVKGKVYDDMNQPIIGARVWIEQGGSITGTKSSVTGDFQIDALKPGLYTINFSASQRDTIIMAGVEVRPDKITLMDTIVMNPMSVEGGVIIVEYKPNKLDVEISRLELETEDIKHSLNLRDPVGMFVSYHSDINQMEGSTDVIIRGSRPGDVVYFVDGVKSDNLNGVPGAGIGSMQGYTGGIPAKYGDTTGGVIILETKSYFDLYYSWKATEDAKNAQPTTTTTNSSGN